MDNWKKLRKPSTKECAQFYLEGSNQQKKKLLHTQREKHIRSKRKWSSILRKKRTKIFSIQAKIKNIETKLDIDFKKILSFAEESLDEILKLDKAYTDSRWNIGTEENLLLPEKITYFQLIRLLRMSDRFNVDISNDEYPKLSINKNSN